MTEPFDAVLAEIKEEAESRDDQDGVLTTDEVRYHIDRLAAAHAAELAERDDYASRCTEANTQAERENDRLRARIAELEGLALRALPYLEDCTDEGPPHEGWKSDGLSSLIGAIAAIATTEQAARRQPVRDQDGNAICTCTHEARCPLHEEQAGP